MLLLLFSGPGEEGPQPYLGPRLRALPATDEDGFLKAFQDLLPRGRAWPRYPEANLTLFLRGLAKSQAAIRARDVALPTDAFPLTTDELLPEWQSTLGLPDPCAGPDQLRSEALAQVATRIKAEGGQSVPYYIGFAADLGYAITITEFTPFVAGDPCGLPLYGTAWATAWEVNDPLFTVHYFEAGVDVAGDPLTDWGNTILQCELARVAPGHTTLFFAN